MQNLGETNSANECGELVKRQKFPLGHWPIGASWYIGKTLVHSRKDCFALFVEPTRIVESNDYESCLFTGKYIASEVNVSCFL